MFILAEYLIFITYTTPERVFIKFKIILDPVPC